jgi:hypothetical protein
MENYMIKVALILLVIVAVTSSVADAANRKGSHRVGGTNSHGKHSHYVGGVNRHTSSHSRKH